MTSPVDHLAAQWMDAGARVAPRLVDASAVLVTGRNATAAARAAIGIAREESARRRVAIGDLVGDVPPLVAMIDQEDPHGIVDSFLYGVSLNKVAHPALGSDNLFVLPSGTEPVLTEEIFRSDRWRRLAGGFREMGALLLLVAPSDAPGLDALAAMMDGVVSVGDDNGELAARFPVLAAVTAVRARPGLRDTMAMPTTAPADPRSGRGARSPVQLEPDEDVAPVPAPVSARRRFVGPLLLLLGLIAGALSVLWVRDRQARSAAARAAAADSARAAAAAAAAVDSAPRDSLTTQSYTVMNAGDSATATAFVIEVAKHNTEEGARLGWQQANRLPVATWFPVRLSNDPNTWYRVVGGGWTTFAEADSALSSLKTGAAVAPTATVVRAPLALLVGSGLGVDSVRARTSRYATAGIHTYVLHQADGTSNLYAGAFETPDQSMFLALALQQMGDVPTLVYRTGRAP